MSCNPAAPSATASVSHSAAMRQEKGRKCPLEGKRDTIRQAEGGRDPFQFRQCSRPRSISLSVQRTKESPWDALGNKMRYCDTLMQDISIQDINSAQHILEQESQPAFLELGQSEKKSRDGGL